MTKSPAFTVHLVWKDGSDKDVVAELRTEFGVFARGEGTIVDKKLVVPMTEFVDPSRIILPVDVNEEVAAMRRLHRQTARNMSPETR